MRVSEVVFAIVPELMHRLVRDPKPSPERAKRVEKRTPASLVIPIQIEEDVCIHHDESAQKGGQVVVGVRRALPLESPENVRRRFRGKAFSSAFRY